MMKNNNKKLKKILEGVLSEIKPSKKYEESILLKLSGIIKKINSGLKNAKAVLGGSGAKGTWLRTFDADIFVLFDYGKFKGSDKKISDILEGHLRKKFSKVARIHGSRDYFQIKADGTTIEIIPILNIKSESEAKNITDISQLHYEWVKKNNRQDEIRLTKQFCKAAGVYGAESYIQGFSGYACEILTIYYGSFYNLAKNAAKWKEKTIIDAEKYFKGKDVFKELNLSKLASPIIIIDPVQKSRNAAAALSYEKFSLFRKRCKNFLKRPNKNFFMEKILDIEKIKKYYKNKKIIKIDASPKKRGRRDVIGSKILKSYDFIKKMLGDYGFKIANSDWNWDEKNKAELYFIVEDSRLEKEKIIAGPPLRLRGHVERFKKSHKKTFVKGSKIMAVEERRFDSAEKLIKRLCEEEYFSGRLRLKGISIY